jgi:ubiquinol-cytochrome c reductase cytochrome c1 subunit
MRMNMFILWLFGIPSLTVYLLITFSWINTHDFLTEKIDAPLYNLKLEYPLGNDQKNTLLRGFQVYRENCMSCHSLQHLKFRDLHGDTGFLTKDVALGIANEHEVIYGYDEDGEEKYNDAIAPLENYDDSYGVPDLSLSARYKPEHYTEVLLLSYTGDKKEEAGETLYSNTAFTGGWIRMSPPLYADIIDYHDGTEATIEQQAYDVDFFLNWASNPAKSKALWYLRIAIQVISTLMIIGVGCFYIWQKLQTETVKQKK